MLNNKFGISNVKLFDSSTPKISLVSYKMSFVRQDFCRQNYAIFYTQVEIQLKSISEWNAEMGDYDKGTLLKSSESDHKYNVSWSENSFATLNIDT